MFLVRDLAIVLVIAGAAAWLCRRLGLSVIIGYLVAGSIIGPHTPPIALVTDPERVRTLAQLGLVFLIFSIGLELNLSRLRRLGLSVILATAIGALLVLAAGRLAGWGMGWDPTASIFLAAMLMVSSSAIIGKVLAESNLAHERAGQLALGVTVLEDAVAILMITLLTSVIQFGDSGSTGLLPTLGGLGAFIVFIALLSLLIVPRLLARISRDGLPEIRTLLVAGMLLSLAWLALRAGYSLALGAFVFGAIVGSTRYKLDIERSFDGSHHIFGAVFFVAVGMQLEWAALLDVWPMVLGISALALVVRPLACASGLLSVGNTAADSIRAGLALAPIGEFSFIIAQLGVESGILPHNAYPLAIGTCILTSLAAPALARNAERISLRIVRARPRLVVALGASYGAWLDRLNDRRTGSLVWQLTRRGLLRVGLHVLFVSALLLFAGPIYERAKESVALAQGPMRDAVPILFWSAFGILLLGPLIAIWRNISALAMILAESATVGAPRLAPLRPILEIALRAVALIVLAAWLLALLPSGWSLLGGAGAVLLLLVTIGAVFWRRLVRLHSRLEMDLLGAINRASHSTATSAWFPSPPREPAEWELDIEEVTLPSDSAHAGKALGTLAIRNRFGCSIVGIDRQGFGIPNPRADTVLYPLDKLLLLGSAPQLAAAVRDLGGVIPGTESIADFDELTMETVTVPEGSPLAGRTLIELDLIRRAGVQIGGIRRDGTRILSPSGQDRLEPGDDLLVLGTHDQIERFATLLAPPPEIPETETQDPPAATE